MLNYWRNPKSTLVPQLEKLEVAATWWVVSLATYLRVSLYLRQHLPYDLPESLSKKLSAKGMTGALNTFEETHVIHPQLGYVVFQYLEKHPKEDVIDPIFIKRMKPPKTASVSFSYWRPDKAIGVYEVAYRPWDTAKHLELLRSYPISDADISVIAYHLRGAMETQPEDVEGIEPIYNDISKLEAEYQQTGEKDWQPAEHTKLLPAMIDIVNQYLSGPDATDPRIVTPQESVWIQRTKQKLTQTQPDRKWAKAEAAEEAKKTKKPKKPRRTKKKKSADE